MIRQLRKQFIAINMVLVSVVLLAVFTVQTYTAYRRAAEEVYAAEEQALEMLENNLVRSFTFFGPPPEGFEAPPDTARGGRRFAQDFLSVPAFAVELDEEGSVILLMTAPGVEVTAETAQAMADLALARTEGHGSLPGQSFSYLYRYNKDADRRLIAFADNASVGANLRQQLLTSLLILLPTLLAFWLISRFLAKLSLKPVEEAWDRERQFVADASHELKTPVTVILANTDIVLAHPEDTVRQQAKWIEYTRDEAGRMKSLVNDLLFLAKSDAAQTALDPVPVELSDMVTGSLMSFESVAFENGVALEDHVAPELTVRGDPAQLRRLVVILLDNAVKYAGEGGKVTVTLDRQGEQPRLVVHNTGPAISAEHLPHLFERFYRSDAARDRQQGGYGLGLAIAKSIVDTHGGKITVTSAENEGTAFTVIFPKSPQNKKSCQTGKKLV